MRRNHYQVRTSTRIVNCESERSAEYIYSCNKHAQIIRNGVIIKEK